MATATQRHHIGAVLDFFHAHAAHLLYPPHDVRTAFDNECWHWSEHTTETMLREGHFWQGDCSEFGSYVLKCAGLWHWSSLGNAITTLDMGSFATADLPQLLTWSVRITTDATLTVDVQPSIWKLA